jgi:filamentous hemagglutinin family protein
MMDAIRRSSVVGRPLLLAAAVLLVPEFSRAGDILRGGATRAGDAARVRNLSTVGQAQALKLRANAQDRLARTTQSLQQMQAAQAAARGAAATANHLGMNPLTGAPLPHVPDGLGPGALDLDRVVYGANNPVQSGNNVTVKQNESQALLHWKTFNVGRNTTLNFDQSAGGADAGKWIALSEVTGADLAPSQILGRINAQGQVYVLNQNGIIFGGASQINTRGFVASSLPINDNLVRQGLLNNRDAQFLFSTIEVPGGGDGTPAFVPPAPPPGGRYGDVIVQRGAQLRATSGQDGNGGRVMLVGPNVRNEGTIETPAGQAILAAGHQVGVRAHPESDPSLRGLDVWIGRVGDDGRAVNAGIIRAPTGNITVAGRSVVQAGVLDSTTTVSLNGRIDLLASYGAVGNPDYDKFTGSTQPPFFSQFTGTVDFAPGSVTRILPDDAGGRRIPGSRLALESSVNVEGRAIHFGPGSILLAPSGEVRVRAGRWPYADTDGDGLVTGTLPSAQLDGGAQKFLLDGGRIHVDSGAVIDASGSTDAFIPLAQHLLAVQMRGSELSDSPLLRNSALRGINLLVDLRRAGVYAGREWVGTPLGDLTGFANIIDRGIAELTARGGNISLSAGDAVVLAPGSVLDVSGGFTTHEPGRIQTSRLTRGRHLFDMHDALPDRLYEGVYDGRSTQASGKWGVSRTYAHALAPLGGYDQGPYQEGAAAGAVSLRAPTIVAAGEMRGRSLTGPRQQELPPAAGLLSLSFRGEKDIGTAANPLFLDSSPFAPEFRLGAGRVAGAAPLYTLLAGEPVPLAEAWRGSFVLGTALFEEDEGGFGRLAVDNPDGDFIQPSGVALRMLPGGNIDVAARNVTLAGDITAPGGSVSFTAYNFSPLRYNELSVSGALALPPTPGVQPGRGDIRIAGGVTLDVAGMMVDERPTAADPAFAGRLLQGGSVRLEGYNVRLGRDSLIDASGGVYAAPNGGYDYGDGGSIRLLAGKDPDLDTSVGGVLDLSGRVQAYSAARGGSLGLQANFIQIGGSAAPAGGILLSPDFFRRGGFADYQLTGLGGRGPNGGFLPAVRVAAGTVVEPAAQSWFHVPYGGLTGTRDLLEQQIRLRGGLPVPAGASEDQLARLGVRFLGGDVFRPVMQPAGLRDPAGLSLTGLGFNDKFTGSQPSDEILEGLGWVVVESGARLSTDPRASVSLRGDLVTVLGDIRAPGGAISLLGGSSFRLPEGLAPNASFALPTVYLGASARLSTAGTSVLFPDVFDRRSGILYPGGSISVSGNILAEAGSVLDVSGAAETLDFHPGRLAGAPAAVPANAGLNSTPWGRRAVPVRVASDAGSIDLRGSQMLFSDAVLRGAAGGEAALGGSLSVATGRFYPSGADRSGADINMTVRQSGSALAFADADGFGAALGDVLTGTGPETELARLFARGRGQTGAGFFAADRFAAGGFDNLDLGYFYDASASPIPFGGNLEFQGPVAIAARGAVRLAGGGILQADNAVRVSAPYVALGQPFLPPLHPNDVFVPFRRFVAGSTPQLFVPPSGGPGALQIGASLIDAGHLSLQGVGSTVLSAGPGDIRGSGSVNVAGTLEMRAGQIYPVTLAGFDVFAYDNVAGGTAGSVTITGVGRPGAPLSAGGRLRVFASEITQAGTLRAPFGSITLGWDGTDTDPSTAALDAPSSPVAGSAAATPLARNLVLAAGSLTSVSGQGLLVPFGLSPDGLGWIDPRGVDVTASGLPANAVSLGADAVDARAGSVIDLRGGGDLAAYRWVPGIGGSIDLLGTAGGVWRPGSSYNAGDLVMHEGRMWSARADLDPADFAIAPEPFESRYWSEVPLSYAILPGFTAPQAPFSPFNSGPNSGPLAGDPGFTADGLRLGEQVLLPGLPGLAAGSYTLLPRRYAVLPGAFLVIPDEGALVGSATPRGTSSPSSRTGLASGRAVRVDEGSYIVPGSVRNSFNRAGRPGPLQTAFEVVPPEVLAGRAAYEVYRASPFLADASRRLDLAAVQPLPADSARLTVQGNSRLNFAAGVLARSTAAGRAAAIDLSSFADIRVIGSAGAAPAGSAAVLDADAISRWGGGSVLIGGVRRTGSAGTVVEPRSGAVTLDNPGGVLTADDLILTAGGTVTLGAGSSLAAGSGGGAAENLSLSGDGALVRVAAARTAPVNRGSAGLAGTGRLVVGPGVSLSGAAVVLDSSGASTIDDSVALTAGSLALGSGQISVVLSPEVASLPGSVVTDHLVLEGRLLSAVSSSDVLRLRSYRSIDLYGSGTLGRHDLGLLELSGGGLRGYDITGSAAIAADRIVLGNPDAVGAMPAPLAATGALQLTSRRLEFGAGDVRLGGFGSVEGTATGGLLASADGSLTVSAPLSLSGPATAVAQGASYAMAADGRLALLPASGAPEVASGSGARLFLQGTSVVAATGIDLPSGVLSVVATTGDVEVGGSLRAEGFTREFFDVVRHGDGGSIDLTARQGSVRLLPGSVVSVAAPAGGGNAGSLTVRSPGGVFDLGGILGGAAGTGFSSGSFLLDAGSVADFAALSADLDAAGFFHERNLRVRNGDVTLAGVTRVRDYSLSVDAGDITVRGTIDASGTTGGRISLATGGHLTVAAGAVLTVAAKEFNSAGQGGQVALEVGSAIGGTAGESAWLDLQSGSTIDLSVDDYVAGSHTTPGSSAFFGQFEGTLHLRAPRVANDVRIAAIGSAIEGGSSLVAEAFRVYRPAGGVMNRALRDGIHADNAAFMNAGEAAATSRLLAAGSGLADIFVLAPGVEIINTAGDLTLGLANSSLAGATNIEGLSDADWDLSGWRYGSRLAPGVLTLRSAGDLVFNNALSDGFTPITKGTAANYADSGHSLLWLAPLQSINDSLPVNTQSWSYRLASGADFGAADFRRTSGLELLDLAQPGKGSVLVGEFFTRAVPNSSTSGTGAGVGPDGQTADTVRINNAANNNDRGTRYEVIRTGTGRIEVAAGRDVQLRNPFATIYTAGAALADGTAVYAAGDFTLPITAPSRHPDQGGRSGLGAPQQNYRPYFGLAGGDVRIASARDIGRFARLDDGSVVADSSMQMPTHWLYRRGLVDPATGLFAPVTFTGLGAFSDSSASTAWWIDYSNFFQGFGALGGGDVRLSAARDLVNADAAIPTSARMAGRDPATGANLAPDASKLRETGGGDLLVEAGGSISGGSFYVERGLGKLRAGNRIESNEARSISPGRLSGSQPLDASTWQAVTLFGGRTQFDVGARGDVLLGPAAAAFLQPQGLNNKFWYKTQFLPFDPSAAVSVASYGGSVTHRLAVGDAPVLATAYAQGSALSPGSAGYYRPWVRLAETSLGNFRTVASTALPALRSTAFGGDLTMVGSLNLLPSATGDLQLLASGAYQGLAPSGPVSRQVGGVTRSLTAWTASRLNLSDADPGRLPGVSAPRGIQQVSGSTDFLTIRQTAADPWVSVSPMFRETGSFSGVFATIDIQSALHAPVPLHRGNPEPVRIYAGGGDITGLVLYSPRHIRAVAQRDITDIAFYLQHVDRGDISVVSAGRDLIPFNANSPRRTSASDLAAGNIVIDIVNDTVVKDASGSPVATAALAGDIQIGGQGILEVLAGRNLDLGIGANFIDGTGVGLTSIGRQRNPFLPFDGAHLVAMAGVGARGGGPAVGLTGSTLDFSGPLGSSAPGFLGDTAEHRAVGALRRLFGELKSVGAAATTGDYSRGYALVGEIFGRSAARGTIFTRARDVRTSSGGSITVAAPGGGVTMASDIFGNPLTPPGIVTQYGGELFVLTDGNVDIGRARIFTLRGGDLTIWSSSGDIAAGTAPKTVVTAPPTRVLIDATSADIVTDLGGLATGGGIGVLASVEGVEPGAVTLLAPRGTVDAGDAGIRATGDITIAAAQVVNADNIAAGGTSAGVPAAAPAAAPNVAGLSSAASSTAATSSAASDVAQQTRPDSATTQDQAPSTITVEVLGYGGGEGREEEEEREARAGSSSDEEVL